jgi:hemerythrin-like domain-containing protein
MRITKNLRADQDLIKRFLTVLGAASVEVRDNKRAKPGFFLLSHKFINEYIIDGFFKKEEVIIKVLEEGGFPPNQGPIGSMRSDQEKSKAAWESLLNTTQVWQSGDESIRTEVGWASSEYTASMRQHLERLKSLIFPLIEQTISMEAEDKVSEEINNIVFEGGLKDGEEKYVKMVTELEEEFSDWK